VTSANASIAFKASKVAVSNTSQKKRPSFLLGGITANFSDAYLHDGNTTREREREKRVGAPEGFKRAKFMAKAIRLPTGWITLVEMRLPGATSKSTTATGDLPG